VGALDSEEIKKSILGGIWYNYLTHEQEKRLENLERLTPKEMDAIKHAMAKDLRDLAFDLEGYKYRYLQF
jgi:hypothetical protein